MDTRSEDARDLLDRLLDTRRSTVTYEGPVGKTYMRLLGLQVLREISDSLADIAKGVNRL